MRLKSGGISLQYSKKRQGLWLEYKNKTSTKALRHFGYYLTGKYYFK